ncbi:MAG: PIN domain-containing protein [Eubacteriaceae bacterium]|nr:PIN domain-containing protein [Eubacteriaceae bacterium]
MKKAVQWISFLIGLFAAYQALVYNSKRAPEPLMLFGFTFASSVYLYLAICVLSALIGLICYALVSQALKSFNSISNSWLVDIRKLSLGQLVFNIIALVVSLILASLVCNPIYKSPIADWFKTLLTLVIYVGLGYMGLVVLNTKWADIDAAMKSFRARDNLDDILPQKLKISKKQATVPKVLDTSVIIDGRIFDILNTGFMEGPIIIPTFVLDELQFIADSPDSLKRNRGRRGLDILNKMQKELAIEVLISDKSYPEITEVDSKLLKLALEMKGKIVTNDFNLNKVAELQGVEVLNTNDLSNAVRSIVLPGEEMNVQIIREGKEHNQGVAYLDDGTMIVVEGAKNLISKNTNVVVTSVLQTSAGRMVFAKPTH